MKTFSAISSLAAVGIVVAGYVKAQATVQSPANLIQCQPAAISWSGASGTVYLSVVLGSNVADAAYITFPQQSGASGSYTWSAVNVTAGQDVTFIVNDSTGAPNYSGQVTVNAGSDDSCLSSDASSSSAAGSPSSTAATSSAASSAASRTSSVATRASSAVSSASASATSAGTSGAAGPLGFNLNAVVIVGAAFAGAAYLV